MPYSTEVVHYSTHLITKTASATKNDALVIEEPLEIRVGFYKDKVFLITRIAVTMRTPGKDEALALGFLFTEGIIKSINEIDEVLHVQTRNELAKGNVIQINLQPEVSLDLKNLQRNFYTTSSCGVCGKGSIEAVQTTSHYSIPKNSWSISSADLFQLPSRLREHQEVFKATGGLHAAALFNVNGDIGNVAEDIGRHNAVDKAIGEAFQDRQMPLSDLILMVSGRAGFELVQKASMAGIPMLAAVGAPSSLSIDLAKETGMTLVGFLKENRCNVYTGIERISG